MNILRTCLLFLLTLATAAHADRRPNIVTIMVDDLGYSDVGCYGGEIDTPTLDALAANGLRFSQFYNTAKCHSSRVSLLSGQYCIAAGDTALSHAVTSAEVLRDSGYFTAMTGKWHLKKQPTDFGFKRYFGHLSGACNYFYGDKSFRLNGESWSVPDKGFYTTVANVDFGLKFIQEARQKDDPWHLYIAFNAPHAPLHALPQDYAKYKRRYAAGWDAIRSARFQKQQRLGLLPEDCRPSPRPNHVPSWDSLSDARKRFEAKRMTTLAAMIDRVDQEIGRLVDDLKQHGELEDTLIWFVSDNGACPYDRISRGIGLEPTNGDVALGDSTGWSWARNTPFRFYKQNQFEGGICSPAIVHWPAGLKGPTGRVHREPAHLIDVMPTLADIGSAEIPDKYDGRELRRISGQSLRKVFEGGSIDRTEPLHFLFASDRGLRDGDWKAVSFRSAPWELYNLKEDRTELDNLADKYPVRLKSMVEKWHSMSENVLHAGPKFVAPVRDTEEPHHHPEWTDFSRDPQDGRRANSKAGQTKAKTQPKRRQSIRARKNTTLEIQNEQLVLTFSGDDPGIAIDHLPTDLPPGPYSLLFEVNSVAEGTGEVFFTTDAETQLPRGKRVELTISHDGKWHKHSVDLTTEKHVFKLRLDVSAGVGKARIRGLQLVDQDGAMLLRLPQASRSAKGK